MAKSCLETNMSDSEDSISERVARLVSEHAELRRRTAYMREDHFIGFQHWVAAADKIAHEEHVKGYEKPAQTFKSWVEQKKISLQEQYKKALAIQKDEEKIEQASLEEETRKKAARRERIREAQARRQQSVGKAESKPKNTPAQRKKENRTVDINAWLQEKEDRKANKSLRKKTEQPRKAGTTVHSSSVKEIPFDDWKRDLKGRKPYSTFVNPHIWVDPVVPEDNSAAVPAPVPAPRTSRTRANTPRLTQSARPSTTPLSRNYLDPSPPLLWRDRDLMERLAALRT